jgi:hypothetical protein
MLKKKERKKDIHVVVPEPVNVKAGVVDNATL